MTRYIVGMLLVGAACAWAVPPEAKLFAEYRKAGRDMAQWEQEVRVSLHAGQIVVEKWPAALPFPAGYAAMSDAEAETILTVPSKHWKRVGNTVTEMTAQEKAAVDEAAKPVRQKQAEAKYLAVTVEVLTEAGDPRSSAVPVPKIPMAELEALVESGVAVNKQEKLFRKLSAAALQLARWDSVWVYGE